MAVGKSCNRGKQSGTQTPRQRKGSLATLLENVLVHKNLYAYWETFQT